MLREVCLPENGVEETRQILQTYVEVKVSSHCWLAQRRSAPW
jgi:hypothetical protein